MNALVSEDHESRTDIWDPYVSDRLSYTIDPACDNELWVLVCPFGNKITIDGELGVDAFVVNWYLPNGEAAMASGDHDAMSSWLYELQELQRAMEAAIEAFQDQLDDYHHVNWPSMVPLISDDSIPAALLLWKDEFIQETTNQAANEAASEAALETGSVSYSLQRHNEREAMANQTTIESMETTIAENEAAIAEANESRLHELQRLRQRTLEAANEAALNEAANEIDEHEAASEAAVAADYGVNWPSPSDCNRLTRLYPQIHNREAAFTVASEAKRLDPYWPYSQPPTLDSSFNARLLNEQIEREAMANLHAADWGQRDQEAANQATVQIDIRQPSTNGQTANEDQLEGKIHEAVNEAVTASAGDIRIRFQALSGACQHRIPVGARALMRRCEQMRGLPSNSRMSGFCFGCWNMAAMH